MTLPDSYHWSFTYRFMGDFQVRADEFLPKVCSFFQACVGALYKQAPVLWLCKIQDLSQEAARLLQSQVHYYAVLTK